MMAASTAAAVKALTSMEHGAPSLEQITIEMP